MSGELEGLVLEALEQGEKCSAEIYHWIKAIAGGGRLLVPHALPNALELLEVAGLIERYTKRKIPQFPQAKPQWIYRLTVDGALGLWDSRTSIPKETTPIKATVGTSSTYLGFS